MGKALAIKGHITRGKEVIELLEMLGGSNINKLSGNNSCAYYINGHQNIIRGIDYIFGYEDMQFFSIEKFLEKYPYKVGDKVHIYVQNDDIDGIDGRCDIEVAEITSMRWDPVRCKIAYEMKNINREFYKEEIKCKVNVEEKPQIDTSIDNYEEIVEKSFQGGYEKCKSEMNMNDNNVDLTLKISTCYVLPDGYHFTDENGNTIDAKKIQLVKNSPTYPKTYNECCDVLKIPNLERYMYIDVPLDYNKLLDAFTELLICRDAYWKIAGEQMGLGKPWEPDFSDDSPKYNIFSYENEITLSDNNWSNRILAFPTIEMRNAFAENFKELIEKCKELL